MWRNILSDEGQNIAKRAEKAQDAGNYALARELYLKAVAKFKEASEICDDFNETSILRSLASYYKNRAIKLENELRSDPVLKSSFTLQNQNKENSATDVPLLLNGTGIRKPVFDAVIKIAIEISLEGREGRAIGTAFVIGDAEKVLANSRQLVLNPFWGHRIDERMITNAETQENIKEFAQLDGVFVVSGEGIVEAAGRYITIDTGMVRMQRGLGTRHSSVAAITLVTFAIGIVVSQSGGVIRIFKDGRVAATIKPFL